MTDLSSWPERPEGHTPDKTGHPWEPWLTRDAIRILERILEPHMKVFEFGCGASTVWYAKRCLLVNAVDHNRDWVELVRRSLWSESLSLSACVSYGSCEDQYEKYMKVAALDLELDGPYDVVVVDGRERVRSVSISAPHVKPGGILVLDNAERERYAEVRKILSGWEVVETSNGIWRTDIYRKPSL